MNVLFYTLGCKVNQYETQKMREALVSAGYTENNLLPADVIVINSCTVTAESDRKTRQSLHRLKANNPGAVTVLAGCYPQALFEKGLTVTLDADIIIGNAETGRLPELLKKYFEMRRPVNALVKHTSCDSLGILEHGHYEGKTRAFVKIEDGCNRFCTYCMVPYARGRVRSKKPEDVIKEIKLLSDSGCREMVLAGINLTAYGEDFSEYFDLGDIVNAVAEIDGIKRIRLGSMEPDQLTSKITDKLSRCGKLCGQFHISLQSGSDRTLERMHRKYDTGFYRSLAKELREKFPGCSLTTDIMVGFPGETEEEFTESLSFAEEIGFSRAHIFCYSRRTGTPAANMPGQLQNSVKESRSKRMAAVTDKTAGEFVRSLVGTRQSVLFERKNENGLFEGYTENYCLVNASSDTDISGEIHSVIIVSADESIAVARISDGE